MFYLFILSHQVLVCISACDQLFFMNIRSLKPQRVTGHPGLIPHPTLWKTTAPTHKLIHGQTNSSHTKKTLYLFHSIPVAAWRICRKSDLWLLNYQRSAHTASPFMRALWVCACTMRDRDYYRIIQNVEREEREAVGRILSAARIISTHRKKKKNRFTTFLCFSLQHFKI